MSAPRSFAFPRPGVNYTRKLLESLILPGVESREFAGVQPALRELENQGTLKKKHMEMEMACKASEQRAENLGRNLEVIIIMGLPGCSVGQAAEASLKRDLEDQEAR